MTPEEQIVDLKRITLQLLRDLNHAIARINELESLIFKPTKTP